MSRRRKRLAFAAAGIALTVLCACGGVTLTAARSVNPVMFGPVKTLGTGAPSRGSSPASGGAPFRHWEWNSAGGVWDYLYWKPHRLSMTNPAGVDGDNPDWATMTRDDAPPWLDWRVFRTTRGNPVRRVDLTSVQCGGTTFSVGLGVVSDCQCELKGTVPAAE